MNLSSLEGLTLPPPLLPSAFFSLVDSFFSSVLGRGLDVDGRDYFVSSAAFSFSSFYSFYFWIKALLLAINLSNLDGLTLSALPLTICGDYFSSSFTTYFSLFFWMSALLFARNLSSLEGLTSYLTDGEEDCCCCLSVEGGGSSLDVASGCYLARALAFYSFCFCIKALLLAINLSNLDGFTLSDFCLIGIYAVAALGDS